MEQQVNIESSPAQATHKGACYFVSSNSDLLDVSRETEIKTVESADIFTNVIKSDVVTISCSSDSVTEKTNIKTEELENKLVDNGSCSKMSLPDPYSVSSEKLLEFSNVTSTAYMEECEDNEVGVFSCSLCDIVLKSPKSIISHLLSSVSHLAKIEQAQQMQLENSSLRNSENIETLEETMQLNCLYCNVNLIGYNCILQHLNARKHIKKMTTSKHAKIEKKSNQSSSIVSTDNEQIVPVVDRIILNFEDECNSQKDLYSEKVMSDCNTFQQTVNALETVNINNAPSEEGKYCIMDVYEDKIKSIPYECEIPNQISETKTPDEQVSFLCKLCNIKLYCSDPVKEHILSTSHDILFQQALLNCEKKSNLQKSEYTEAVNITMQMKCMLCSVEKHGHLCILQHLASKKHLEKLKFRNSCELKIEQSIPAKTSSSQNNSCSSHVEKDTAVISQADARSSHKLFSKESMTKLFCELCNIKVTCQKNLFMHFNGKAHKLKLKSCSMHGMKATQTSNETAVKFIKKDNGLAYNIKPDMGTDRSLRSNVLPDADVLPEEASSGSSAISVYKSSMIVLKCLVCDEVKCDEQLICDHLESAEHEVAVNLLIQEGDTFGDHDIKKRTALHNKVQLECSYCRVILREPQLILWHLNTYQHQTAKKDVKLQENINIADATANYSVNLQDDCSVANDKVCHSKMLQCETGTQNLIKGNILLKNCSKETMNLPDRAQNNIYPCELCDTHMTSIEDYMNHIAGPRHKKNVKKRSQCSDNLNKNVDPSSLQQLTSNKVVGSTTVTTGDRKLSTEIASSKTNYFRCKLCNTHMHSQNDYDCHVNGARHKYNFEQMQHYAKPTLNRDKQFQENNLPNDSLKPSITSNKSQQITFECKLCNALMSSKGDYDSHINGFRHQYNQKQAYNYDKCNKSNNSAVVNSSNNYSKMLFCQVCNVQVPHEKNMKSHIEGKNHILNKIQCAVSLPVAKLKLSLETTSAVDTVTASKNLITSLPCEEYNKKKQSLSSPLNNKAPVVVVDTLKANQTKNVELKHVTPDPHDSLTSTKLLCQLCCTLINENDIAHYSCEGHTLKFKLRLHLEATLMQTAKKSASLQYITIDNKLMKFWCIACSAKLEKSCDLEEHVLEPSHLKNVNALGKCILSDNSSSGEKLLQSQECLDRTEASTGDDLASRRLGSSAIGMQVNMLVLTCKLCNVIKYKKRDIRAHLYDVNHTKAENDQFPNTIPSSKKQMKKFMTLYSNVSLECLYCKIILKGTLHIHTHLHSEFHSQNVKNFKNSQCNTETTKTVDALDSPCEESSPSIMQQDCGWFASDDYVVLNCKLCNVILYDEAEIHAHLNDSSHGAVYQKELLKKKISYHDALPYTLYVHSKIMLKCSLCQVIIHGQVHILRHFSSNVHLTVVSCMLPGNSVAWDMNKLPPLLAGDDNSTRVPDSLARVHKKQYRENQFSVLQCGVCDVTVHGSQQVKHHLAQEQHKEAFQTALTGITQMKSVSFGMSLAKQIINSEIMFSCELCQISLRGELDITAHLTDENHLLTENVAHLNELGHDSNKSLKSIKNASLITAEHSEELNSISGSESLTHRTSSNDSSECVSLEQPNMQQDLFFPNLPTKLPKPLTNSDSEGKKRKRKRVRVRLRTRKLGSPQFIEGDLPDEKGNSIKNIQTASNSTASEQEFEKSRQKMERCLELNDEVAWPKERAILCAAVCSVLVADKMKAAHKLLQSLGYNIPESSPPPLNTGLSSMYLNSLALDSLWAVFQRRRLHQLETLMGYIFDNKIILLQAVTLPSCTTNQCTCDCSQLVVVGEAVLQTKLTCAAQETQAYECDLVTKHPLSDATLGRAAARHRLQRWLLHGSPALAAATGVPVDKECTNVPEHVYTNGLMRNMDDCSEPKEYSEIVTGEGNLTNAVMSGGSTVAILNGTWDFSIKDDAFASEEEVLVLLCRMLQALVGAVYVDSNMSLDQVRQVCCRLMVPELRALKTD